MEDIVFAGYLNLNNRQKPCNATIEDPLGYQPLQMNFHENRCMSISLSFCSFIFKVTAQNRHTRRFSPEIRESQRHPPSCKMTIVWWLRGPLLVGCRSPRITWVSCLGSAWQGGWGLEGPADHLKEVAKPRGKKNTMTCVYKRHYMSPLFCGRAVLHDGDGDGVLVLRYHYWKQQIAVTGCEPPENTKGLQPKYQLLVCMRLHPENTWIRTI